MGIISGIKGIGSGVVSGIKSFGSGTEKVLTGYEPIKYKPKPLDISKEDYQIRDRYSSLLAEQLGKVREPKTYEAEAARVGPAATVAPTDTSGSQAVGGQQTQIAQQLATRAAGGAPSAAEMQMNRALAQAISAQRAQAATARGIPAGMAEKMAQEGIVTAQSDIAARAAEIRAQEQAQAEQALVSALGQQRGQQIETEQMAQQRALAETGYSQEAALQQAGYEQQVALANQQAAMQAEEQANQAFQNYLLMGMNREQAQQQALADYNALMAQQQMAAQQLISQQLISGQAQKTQARTKIVGGLMKGISSGIAALAMSDKTKKKNIRKMSKGQMTDFLEKLTASSYDYKDPDSYGHGKHIGVMAQDVGKSRVGKTFVVDTPEGKMLDIRRGFGALLASQKSLHDRIKSLESRAA